MDDTTDNDTQRHLCVSMKSTKGKVRVITRETEIIYHVPAGNNRKEHAK